MTPPLGPRRSQEQAVLRSVIYASLFDYPLTLSQLCASLIGEPADRDAVARWYAASPRLRAAIAYDGGYFYPRGRTDLPGIRRRREAASRQLLRRLQRPLSLVVHMPFVRMVALSGSLAHLNADGEPDLDLFVVTRPGRVWSVTLTTFALARLLGWRRQLCLNYVVSERALMVGPADLFSANQIIHLKPVIGGAVYRRFLDANRFVERFYPNFHPHETTVRGDRAGRLRTILEPVLDWSVAPLYERLCRVVYGWHLRRRAPSWPSRDQVRLDAECLKLHTSSHRREVMERFERALDPSCPSCPSDPSYPSTRSSTPEESWPVPGVR